MCLGLNDALSHVTWPPSHGFSNLMGITSSCFTPLMNLLLCCVYAVSPHTSKDNLSSTVCGRGHRPGKSSHSHRAGIMVLSIYVDIAAFPSVAFLLSNCTWDYSFPNYQLSLFPDFVFFLISLVVLLPSITVTVFEQSTWIRNIEAGCIVTLVCPVLPPWILHYYSSLPFLYDLSQQSSVHVLVLILHPIFLLLSLCVEFFVPVKDQFLAWFISNKAMLLMKFFS